jgi:hypothetical protein
MVAIIRRGASRSPDDRRGRWPRPQEAIVENEGPTVSVHCRSIEDDGAQEIGE